MRPLAVAIVAVLVVVGPIALGLWVVASSAPDPSQGVTGVMTIVILSAIIGFAGYLGVLLHEKNWRQSAAEEWKSNLQEYQEGLDERIVASFVACNRCGSVAAPILNSQNRYRCSKCGQEFADAEHSLFDLDEYIRRNPRPSDRSYPLMP